MDKYYVKEKDEKGNEIVSMGEDGKPVFKDVVGADAYKVIKDRLELERQLKELEKRQDYLLELSDKWVTEGVFGKGFYHGDLRRAEHRRQETGPGPAGYAGSIRGGADLLRPGLWHCAAVWR